MVSSPRSSLAPARSLGRYVLLDAIASGGMATVHLARLSGPAGFARMVAIKRLHAHLAMDAEFRSMFVDEARLAARIKHPNVVPIVDVVNEHGELFLVMEYVAGEALARLPYREANRGAPVPPSIASAIISGVLHGLHAAHEATNERGESLRIVHRDVSPQNILVGEDGIARVIDFGVAKAVGRLHTTRDGAVKGKLAYMAPEQVRGKTASRQSDIYAASVVLWEMLAGRRLFAGADEAEVVEQVLIGLIDPPSKHTPGVSAELDELVLRGLDLLPERRFATAREMALALEKCAPTSRPSEVSAWIEAEAGAALAARARQVAAAERREAADAPTLTDVSARVHATKRSWRASRSTAAIGLIACAVGAGAMIARGERRDAVVATPSAPAHGAPSTEPALALSVASAEPSAVTPSATTPRRGGMARPHALAPPPARRPPESTNECRVPYEIDGTGRKIYKRDCL